MRRGLLLRLVVLGALAAAACSQDAEPEVSQVSLPFALPLDCASPPEDLEAVLWQSGKRAPDGLDVDLEAGTTEGRVTVTAGAVRRLVIDWFVERPLAEGDVRVLLAQATAELDLRDPEAEEVVLEIAPDDVEVTDCADVRFDLSRVGSATQDVGGAPHPVCDLDESCQGALAPACSNLGEMCAGGDPLAE